MKYIIYLIAFLEGFTTLSVEIVALRKFTPIVGTNSISTSIVLGVILLALSYWYYIWGKISAEWKNIEKRLMCNLIVSSLYYFFVTFLFTSVVLQWILDITSNYAFSLILASVILFFIPVFLASQTIPLLADLLKWSHSWEKMWKLLFYSTIGSFLGSVGTSIFLFPVIWVFKTGIISSILLSLCALLVALFLVKLRSIYTTLSATILVFYTAFIISYEWNISGIIFEKSNAYHDIKIYDSEWWNRIFLLDDWYSSWIDIETKSSFFNYILEVEKSVIELRPKNVLVIWAAGFTFPHDISQYDFVQNIDVVDVDSTLKDITEEYFLETKLSPKINFYPVPSRFFLNNISEKKYDLILVDAYSGKSLPPQVLTKEFFEKLTQIWDNIFLNIIIDADLESDFSKNLFSTLHSVFWTFYYNDVTKWLAKFSNVIITDTFTDEYLKIEEWEWEWEWALYRDDKHSIEKDLFALKKMNF